MLEISRKCICSVPPFPAVILHRTWLPTLYFLTRSRLFLFFSRLTGYRLASGRTRVFRAFFRRSFRRTRVPFSVRAANFVLVRDTCEVLNTRFRYCFTCRPCFLTRCCARTLFFRSRSPSVSRAVYRRFPDVFCARMQVWRPPVGCRRRVLCACTYPMSAPSTVVAAGTYDVCRSTDTHMLRRVQVRSIVNFLFPIGAMN